MRLQLLTIVVAIALVAPAAAAPTEAALRRASDAERTAVLAHDVAALDRLFAADLVVNSPMGDIQDKAGVLARLGPGGLIDYAVFERTAERVRIDRNFAIEMGGEIIADRAGPLAGVRRARRYTNLYRYADGRWQMFARHANLVTALPPR